MIAIDTNVLVRVLIEDASAKFQCEQARNLVNTEGDLWVSKIVLLETVWVLESVYRLNQFQVISVLEKLCQHPHIHLESPQQIETVLTVFSASHADFADCLILNEAQHKRLVLHTFDRKLARLHGAEWVGHE